MDTTNFIVVPKVGMDSAKHTQCVAIPRNKLPLSWKKFGEQVLVREYVCEKFVVGREEPIEFFCQLLRWIQDNCTRIKKAMGGRCIWYFLRGWSNYLSISSIWAVFGNPVVVQKSICRKSFKGMARLPIRWIMLEFARIAGTDKCGADLIICQVKIKKIIHILFD